MLIDLVDVIDEYSAGVVARRYVMSARVPQALVQRGAAFAVRAGGRHLATNNNRVVQHPSTDQDLYRHAEPRKTTMRLRYLNVVVQIPDVQSSHAVDSGEERRMDGRPLGVVHVVREVFKRVQRPILLHVQIQ